MTPTIDSVVIGMDDPALTQFFSGKAPGDEVTVEVEIAGKRLQANGQLESVDEKMAVMNLQKYTVEGEETTPEAEPKTSAPSPAETKWLSQRTKQPPGD